MITEYLVRWEKAPLAWVLYKSEAGLLLWQQIADNGAIVQGDIEGAYEWAQQVIEKEGFHRFTLYGPDNKLLNSYPQID